MLRENLVKAADAASSPWREPTARVVLVFGVSSNLMPLRDGRCLFYTYTHRQSVLLDTRRQRQIVKVT